MRHCLFICISVLFVFCSCGNDGWFDVSSDWWKEPELPVSYKYRYIDFDKEENDLIEHFKYKGEYSTANFTITKDKGMDWLTITKENAILTNDIDESFHIILNTEYLKEGPNAGKITYFIKEEEGKQWVVPVSATGNIDVRFDKKQIDFGKVNVQSSLTLKSMTGKRVVNFIEYPDWINLSTDVVELNQYNGDEKNVETVTVTCDRSKLPYGKSIGKMVIKSEGGLLDETIDISVDMIEHNDSVHYIDEYGFKLEKIYKNEENVILVLKIENGRFLKSFILDTSISYAESGSIKYQMDDAKLKLERNKSGNMIITIKDVPETVNSFSVISIKIKDITQSIEFENVEL